ncbi:MAG: uridine kinase [Verrucomicrobiota bacterium]
MKVQFIAIAGGSGSGKTWLSHRLASHLGSRASLLSLDDFYQDRSHLTPSERRHVNFDHPRALDWPEFFAVVSRLQQGKTTPVPKYDFTVSNRSGTRRRMRPAPLILVDGLWPLQAVGAPGLYSLTIFVDATASERLARRIERDRKERARTVSSIQREFRSHVEPMHQRFVEPQRKTADVVIPSPMQGARITKLVQRIERLLASPE